jgi:hypothetical protein
MYVVRGAHIKCSYSNEERQIDMPRSHGAYIKGALPIMHETDNVPFENIPSFGMCNKTKTQCVPDIIGPWKSVAENVYIKGGRVLTTDSYLVCLTGGGIIRFTDSGQDQMKGSQVIREPMTPSVPEDPPLKHPYLEDLSKGSENWREVTRVQVWLTGLGLYKDKIDGGFGKGTTEALIEFQKQNSLESDGVVNQDTWTRLQNKYYEKAEHSDRDITMTAPLEIMGSTPNDSSYGMRLNPATHKYADHNGIDIGRGASGAEVRSTMQGFVVLKLSFKDVEEDENRMPRGNTILIQSSENPHILTVSQHLDTMSVNVGDFVSPETVIGTVGRTGRVTGAHLHFEVLFDENGDKNPYTERDTIYGTALEPWIFLP